MGREMVTNGGLRYGAVDAIAERLSVSTDLYLPHSVFAARTEQVSQQEKKEHLVSLLHRDAAIFLERYGKSLQETELEEFDVLENDYEVGWHLKQLKAALNPSPEQRKSKAAAVKNRRLAYMEKLMVDGQYFSEDAMRMRSPLLHHEYIGQFQDPATRGIARPGENFADLLIRQSDEAFIQQKLKEERKQAGILSDDDNDDKKVQEEEEEEEEEEDEEEEEEDEDDEEDEELSADDVDDKEQHKTGTSNLGEEPKGGGPMEADVVDGQRRNKRRNESDGEADVEDGQRGSNGLDQLTKPRTGEADADERLQEFAREMQEKFISGEEAAEDPKLSEEELKEKLQDFTRVMQEKFLNGEDAEHIDYGEIDENAALDDYWLTEVSHEAEEKYFEED